MIKKLKMVAFFVFTSIFLGCSVEESARSNFYFTPLSVTNANVPSAFVLNESYEIAVTYTKPDNCTFFEQFDVTQEDQTVRNIVAIGFVQTDQNNCAATPTEETSTFNFKVIYPNPYIFKFYSGDDKDGNPEYLEVEIPVNTP